MSDKHDKTDDQPAYINANRRGFLQGAAVAGGVAATGVAVAADTVDETPVQLDTSVKSKGYKRSEHVEKYYQRARF